MIYIYDEVKEFVIKMFQKTPILRYSQLRELLKVKFDVDDEQAKNYVIALQKDGYFLVSKTGYCLTKQLYLQWSHDKFLDNVNKNNKLIRLGEEFYVYSEPLDSEGIARYQATGITTIEKELSKNSYRENILNSMWVIASYLPKSEDFIVGQPPFEVSFVYDSDDEFDSTLFQIMNTNSKNIMARVASVKQNGKVDNKKFMEHIHRIAIVEKPEQAILIPKLGFSLIVYIDHTESGRIYCNEETGQYFKIAEIRESFEERWADCL